MELLLGLFFLLVMAGMAAVMALAFKDGTTDAETLKRLTDLEAMQEADRSRGEPRWY